VNSKPRLQTPRSGPSWTEGRDARRQRHEAALRALGELEEAAWRGRAWAQFARVEDYYRDAS
jgi:hypothetical protein